MKTYPQPMKIFATQSVDSDEAMRNIEQLFDRIFCDDGESIVELDETYFRRDADA